MIVETSLAKLLAAGGGLISSVVLIAGLSGGAKYAAASTDAAALSRAVCSYGSHEGSGTERPLAFGLTTEQLANAQTIVDEATSRGLPRRAVEIALATALQESHLDNSAVGDHGKAFGMFQQHPDSGWGTRSQVTTPGYAARAFYERLVKVRGWEAMPLTKAAAIVQRPKEDLRREYAKHKPLAQKLAAALSKPATAKAPATGFRNVGLSPAQQEEARISIKAAAGLGIPRQAVVADVISVLANQMPGVDPAEIKRRAEHAVITIAGQLCADLSVALNGISGDVLAGTSRGAIAVQAALRMRGIPYSWGGGGPSGPSYGIGRGARTSGFDCSGLTEYAWAKAGARIGGDTSAQWNAGAHIPRKAIQPGDLIFFAYNPSNPATIHHVGIAIDSTRMVHAPFTGSTVRVQTWAGIPEREGAFIGVVRPP
ncbi:C40 family peptidase [Planotetraspora kaengkrachanensis]|uniref:Lipoprotein n=1 Tax=Planotetraspora kaengkrachanensis TaxID=575193 RepID=A0A8J3PS84_9ACTN|nr:C40 family peptidase [Planotetraspora kaengkrachanensis]GIG79967.1 lipoprotein [Planotetraspora kaengkrachanensis]